MTVRAFRPRSSVPILTLPSSSMTSNGMITSLSANMKIELGLWSRTFVSTTKVLESPLRWAVGEVIGCNWRETALRRYKWKDLPQRRRDAEANSKVQARLQRGRLQDSDLRFEI